MRDLQLDLAAGLVLCQSLDQASNGAGFNETLDVRR
jgi:hypothetical protein